MGPEAGAAISERLALIAERLAPWKAETEYFNFIERAADVDELFEPEVADRLAEVKRTWDPDGLLRANHAPAPAPA